MADFRIVIQMDTSQVASGAARVRGEMENLSRVVDRVRNLIRGAFVFAGIGVGIKAITDLADAYTYSQNRIRTVARDSAELNLIMGDLFKISTDTGVKFETVAEIYTRTASSAKNLGRSQQELINFTRSLNQAVVISGANSNEANGALIQLSQGIGSAALRGQELRSVLTQLPAVADIIVAEFNRLNKGANYTRASLRELGEQGKITPKIILDAFKNANAQLESDFQKVLPTVQRAIQSLRTNLIEMLGDFNKNTGAQGQFARAIQLVADNLDILGRIALVAGVAIGVNLAKKGIDVATAAMKEFSLAIIRNPLGALVTLLGLAITTMIAFGDQIKIGGGYLGNLQDLALTVFEDIKEGIAIVVDYFQQNFPNISKFAKETFGDMDISVAGFVRGFFGYMGGLVGFSAAIFSTIGLAWDKLVLGMEIAIKESFNAILSTITSTINTISDAINTLTDKFRGIPKIGQVGFSPFDTSGSRNQLNSLPGLGQTFGDNASKYGQPIADLGDKLLEQAEERARKRIAEEERLRKEAEAARARAQLPGTEITSGLGKKEKLETFDNIIAKLRAETDALLLNKDAREIANKEAAIAYRLKVTELSAAQKAILEPLLKENQLRQRQADILDSLREPQDNLVKGQEALNGLFERGAITLEEYNNELRKLQLGALAAGRDMQTGLKRGLLEIQEQFGNVAGLASETLVGAFGKAENSLVQFFQIGKLGFKDLVASIEEDITRLAVRAAITAPLANFLGIGGGASGGGGFLSSLFGGGSSGGGIGSLLSSLFGFADGGSMMVGGTGGTDSQLVAFRATPGEEVSIKTPKQKNQRGNSGMIVNFNITTPDANSFMKSQGQVMATASAVLNRAQKRNM